MDRKILASRLRQILALDINARDIYSELARLAPKESQREVFSKLAKEEERHSGLDKQMLLLLEE